MPSDSLEGVSILIDAYNLQLRHGTGIKTYGKSLIRTLQRLDADVAVLYSHAGVARSDHPALREISFFDPDAASGRLRRRWEALTAGFRVAAGLPLSATHVPGGFVIRRDVPDDVRLLNASRCYDIALAANRVFGRSLRIASPARYDIWHATYPLPIRLRNARSVVTIHDLVPFRLPYTTRDRKREQFQLHRKVIRETDAIFTVSEASKADLVALFGTDPDRIDVTYQAVDVPPLSEEEEEWLDRDLARLKLERRNYLLFVGAIEPKKNLRTLLEAYLRIDTDIPLVIVGKKAWLWEAQLEPLERVEESLAKERVRLLDFVDQDDLRILYAGALGFVFPSLYEGFGLPPVEAMALGVPVITSNVASLPEVCGDGALYVDPQSPAELRHALERLLGDPDLRSRLADAGRLQAARFDVESYATRLQRAYRKLL